jgi:hypothetical protein
MYIVRVLFGAYFLFSSVIWALVPLHRYKHFTGLPVWKTFLLDGFAIMVASIFAVAGWILLRERRSSHRIRGRAWPLAASVLSFSIFTGLTVLYCYLGSTRIFWQTERIFGVPQLVGLAGALAFWNEMRKSVTVTPSSSQTEPPAQ